MKFPEGFLWGTSTAAHQVEGDNCNDWTEWELKYSEKLAKKASKTYSYLQNWETIKEKATDPSNYISGKAVDHYNLYKKDIDIMSELGFNSYRFSIEWARIEPKEGVFDEKELNHYIEVLKYLKQKNIEPVVTIWHWTLPLWLSKKKGILYPHFVERFARYSEYLGEHLKPYVKYWVTLNEPEVYTGLSYLQGERPPKYKNLYKSVAVFFKLIDAHKAAYTALKKCSKDYWISIAKNNIAYYPESNSLGNKIVAGTMKFVANDFFLMRIRKHMDYIGLNHYFRVDINVNLLKTLFKNMTKGQKLFKREGKIFSDFGWELYPESLYVVLKDLKGYNLPIIVTEHGLADAEDKYREWFIKDSLKYVAKAVEEGIDVRGYMHWSLIDNFEWSQGFWPEFGLVSVDRKTMERKVRKSALTYSKIAKSNEVD